MTETPSWATAIPPIPGVHPTSLSSPLSFSGIDHNTLITIAAKLVESVLQQVVLALKGIFLPGELGVAFDQLVAWGESVFDGITDSATAILEAIGGFIGAGVTDIATFFTNLRDFLFSDFFSGTFDLATAVSNFITNILNPAGILAIASTVATDISTAVDTAVGLIVAAINGVAGTITDLTTFFTNLRDFLYSDFLSPAFTVADAAESFITQILSPSGLLTVVGDIVGTVVSFINDVINLGAGGGSSFPYTFPIRFADGGPIARFFRNIASLLNLNLADAAFDLAEAILTVMSQLGIQQIIDYIYNAFTYGVDGILTTVGNTVGAVFNTILGIFGTAYGAQTTAASILAQISGSAAGGTSVVDSFDYAAASDMPGAHYDRIDVDAGSGTYGPTGTGYAAWVYGSSSHTTFYRRNDTTLSSDHGEVHLVLATALQPNSLGPDPLLYLAGRGNSANTEAVLAMLSEDAIQFQYVLASTATNIGSPVTWHFGSGDHIIFRFGIGAADRRYQLLVNNHIVADVTEVGTSSAVGASNRRCGFGAKYSHPVYPPTLTIFAMADQTY